MRLNNAIISISNLRLRTYIGFNEEEKEKKQDVVINIEINYAVTETVLNDHISDALNYKDISKKVIQHVEDASCCWKSWLPMSLKSVANINR